MQKGFGLIGILFVIAIIGILGVSVFKAGYVNRNPFVPTSEEKSAIKMAEELKNTLEGKNNENIADETKDWKTYRNEEYGFEFKYPIQHTLNINIQKYAPGNIRNLSSFAVEIEGSDLFVYIYPADERDAATWVINETRDNIFDTLPDWAKYFKSNVESIAFSQTKAGGKSSFYIWAKENDIMLHIRGMLMEQNLRILSTFKFLP